MSRWFRLYDSVLDDPKVQALPPLLFKTWINLLCVASRNEGRLPDIPALAFMLRKPERSMAADMAALRKAGLIDDGDGGSSPHKWSERQYKSDVSTDRVRAFRERHRNVSSAVAETRSDTEAEKTETETDFHDMNTEVRLSGERALKPTLKLVAEAIAFPAAGSIAYVEPWLSLSRKYSNGKDPDYVAGKFRPWCVGRGIAFDDPKISEIYVGFCKSDYPLKAG